MSFRDQGQFRRKFPRRAFNRPVGVLHAGFYTMSHAGEIGEGGMSVLLPEALPEGAAIVVNFGIPGGHFVSLRAQVRSVQAADDGHLHGVSFVSAQFTHKRQIRAFVSAREAGESLII